jgi:hypothetical protein
MIIHANVVAHKHKSMPYEIQYIKPRINALLRFRRAVKGFGLFLCFIAFILLLPYFSISDNNPDLKVLWLAEFQPIITYKIILSAFVIGLFAIFIELLNIRKIPSQLTISNNAFDIDVKGKSLMISFKEISLIRLSFANLDEPGKAKYRIVIATVSNEYIIHFKDDHDGGKELLRFFKENKKLRIIQEETVW